MITILSLSQPRRWRTPSNTYAMKETASEYQCVTACVLSVLSEPFHRLDGRFKLEHSETEV
jgi:hypothetical protein